MQPQFWLNNENIEEQWIEQPRCVIDSVGHGGNTAAQNERKVDVPVFSLFRLWCKLFRDVFVFRRKFI